MMKKIIALLCVSIFSIFLSIESRAEEKTDKNLIAVFLHNSPGIGEESRAKVLESVINLLRVSTLRGRFIVFNESTVVHQDFPESIDLQNTRHAMNVYISAEKPFLTYTVVRTMILANEDWSFVRQMYLDHACNSRELSSASAYNELGKDIAQTIAKFNIE